MRQNFVRLFLILILAGVLAACGPAAGTVDGDSIAATVITQVRAELADAVETAPAATGTPVVETPAEVVPVNAPPEESEPTAVAPAADVQSSLTNVYRQANPAVVYIVVPPVGSGSGFVYSQDGLIVTNNHVVEGGEAYEVVFASGERMAAELVGADVDSDLAVLKVEQLPEGVAPLPLGDTDSLEVGQLVVAIGNPFGEEGSMSMGIVSALGRSLPSARALGMGSSYSLPKAIQTDAPINPGNSGGPLLNLTGEVIGVNSRIASTTGTNSGVGFAIPVEAVKRIVPSLVEGGSYEYPYIGAGFDDEVSLSDLQLFGVSQTQGAYVLNVTPNSPAAQAGLIAADPSTGRGGDLVVAIDGQPVNEFSDLNAYLVFHTSPGQTIELTVLRGGEEVTVPVTLASRP